MKTPFLAPMTGSNSLTVRLLVTGAGTGTAELLGLHAPVVGNEEGAVVGDEGLLELVLAVLVDVLLVVGNLYAEAVVSACFGCVECGLRKGLNVVAGFKESSWVDVQCPWQWPDGWRRPGKCVHHHGRGRGCQCRLQQQFVSMCILA